MRPEIVLHYPQYEGNVGAVARVMKNFGFENLVLVEPCNLGEEAERRAKHATDVLRNAKVLDELRWNEYDYVIGTTGIERTDTECVDISNVSKHLPDSRTAIVFGSEGTGLSNEDAEKCDVLVKIPTSNEYPVMNLSHAVAIVLYEMSGMKVERSVASRGLRAEMAETFISILNTLGYTNVETASESFTRLLNTVPPSNNDATALVGAVKAIEKGLNTENQKGDE